MVDDLRLPTHPLPLIGRAQELAQISALLENPACRLLTLAGPGGIGKTRLAIEAARRAAPSYVQGVHFVPLQPLDSLDLIVPEIAEAVGFQFYHGADTRQQLLGFFREKSLLLVLDNLEHLLQAAQLVTEILAAAPGVKLLTTSRERLNLREEWLLDLPGLSLPEADDAVQAADYEALQLFLQQAQRVRVGLELDAAQMQAAARICRLVGGMPLGIELAAAWVRTLSCQEIAAEIECSLDILATSARDMPARHRSMRAALQHSWTLLSDTERRVCNRLSLFHEGFRKEAAVQVAIASLPLLSSLVDKSLLRVDTSGRYQLHELLRQYSAERLAELPADAAQSAERHCHYYAHFMNTQLARMTGSEFKAAMREITTELENVRAAWDWAVSQQQPEIIDLMLDSLWLFYDTDHRHQEGELVFEQAVRKLKELAPDYLWASVQARQAALCFFARPHTSHAMQESLALLQESLALLRPSQADKDLAFTLYRLWFATRKDDWDPRCARLEESLALYRKLNDLWGQGQILDLLCRMGVEEGHLQGSETLLRQAQAYGQQSLALYEQGNCVYGIAMACLDLGSAAYWLEAYPQAYNNYQRSLEIFRQIGISWGFLYASAGLGEAACALGRITWPDATTLQALEYISSTMTCPPTTCLP